MLYLLRNKIVAAIFLFQILFAGVAAAETLTIESCVRTALEKHPDMVAAESKVASKKAAVGQSAADSRPQIKGCLIHKKRQHRFCKRFRKVQRIDLA